MKRRDIRVSGKGRSGVKCKNRGRAWGGGRETWD